jgi:hypothetical protein
MNEDEIRSQREKCADCGGQLHEIKVFEQGHGTGDIPLRFGGKDSKRSMWTGTIPTEGTLMAFMCSACARVSFYGATKSG